MTRATRIIDPFEALRRRPSGIVAMPDPSLLRRLTYRETLILEMIGRGLTYKEIASVLQRREGVIRAAKLRLSVKLGESRPGVLVRFAVEVGLVSLGVAEIRRRLASASQSAGA